MLTCVWETVDSSIRLGAIDSSMRLEDYEYWHASWDALGEWVFGRTRHHYPTQRITYDTVSSNIKVSL